MWGNLTAGIRDTWPKQFTDISIQCLLYVEIPPSHMSCNSRILLKHISNTSNFHLCSSFNVHVWVLNNNSDCIRCRYPHMTAIIIITETWNNKNDQWMRAHLDAVLVPVWSHCCVVDVFGLQTGRWRYGYVTAKLQRWWIGKFLPGNKIKGTSKSHNV